MEGMYELEDLVGDDVEWLPGTAEIAVDAGWSLFQ